MCVTTVTRQPDMCDTALYLLIWSHLYLHILHRFTPNLAHSWQTGAHPIYVTRAKHPVPFVFTRIRNTTRVLCRLTLTATVQMGPHSRPKRFRIPEHKAFVIRPLLFQNYIPHTWTDGTNTNSLTDPCRTINRASSGGAISTTSL